MLHNIFSKKNFLKTINRRPLLYLIILIIGEFYLWNADNTDKTDERRVFHTSSNLIVSIKIIQQALASLLDNNQSYFPNRQKN